MPQTITHDISVTDTITETLAYGLASTNVQAQSTPRFSWTGGTGSGQEDLHIEKSYTLAASASTTLTLSALTDDLGRSVALARVRRLSVYLTAKTGSDYLTLGAAVTNPWTAPFGSGTDTLKVRDYLLLVGAGATAYVVTASASDQLKVTNSGAAPITFTVAISGASA